MRPETPPSDMPRIDQVTTVSHAARALHKSTSRIHQMIARKELEAWKLDGTLWVIAKASLRGAQDRQARREAAHGPTDDRT